MVEKDSTEVEFVKNFRLNGKWDRVALSKAEVKEIQMQHIKDLCKLLVNVSFEVKEDKSFEGVEEEAIKLIFEAVAPKNFTVIQCALDKKILNHRESKNNE